MSDSSIKTNKDNLTRQASKGAFWALSSNLSVSAMSFIGTAVLARILSPKDFGLLGMAMLITGMVQLFGKLGLGAALVHKKNINDEYLSTAFWSSILVSVGLFLVSIVIAPLASMFFNEPTVKWIVIFLSANFIISSLSSIQRTMLYKDIRIKKISLIEIVSRFVRVIIMLACAFAGMGFWSIVVGMIFESVLKAILFILTAHWKPTLKFNSIKFKELFHYGKNIYGQGFLSYFNQNMDFIVTGKLLGAKLLGFYQFSYNLPYLVKSFVQDGIGPVVFPVFSQAQDDTARLARGLFSAMKYVSMITFPLMFGLAFCAEDFISVIYGTKWLTAAAPLRLLCFGAALASVHSVVPPLFNAKGRPDIGFKWGLFLLPITIVSVIFFSRFGIIGVAGAMLFTELLTIYLAYIATTLLNLKFSNYVRSLMPAICSSLSMLIVLYLANFSPIIPDNIYLRFATNAILGAIIYTSFLLIVYKKDVVNLAEFMRLCVTR